MEVKGCERLIQYSSDTPRFTIYDVSDIHFGNEGCCKQRLARDIDRIKKDPSAYWLLGGDYCDWISPGDKKRWDAEVVDPELIKVKDLGRIGETLTRELLERLDPIRGKCLGACYGNHEYKYMQHHEQQHLHERFCEALGVQNLRYSAFLHLYFEKVKGLKSPVIINNPAKAQLGKKGQNLLRVIIHHGFSAAQSAGGKMNAMKRLADSFSDCDVAFMGHLHEQLSKLFTRLKPNQNHDGLTEEKCQVVMSGSYLRAFGADHTSYAEMRGYMPTSLGAMGVRYYPNLSELEVVSRSESAGKKL